MTVPHSLPAARGKPLRPFAVLGLVSALLGSACVAGTPGTAPTDPNVRLASGDAPKGAPPGSKETLVGGRPLFADWPKGQKPDAVIVFTGQTFGFLQPCGCSRPQTGGLERRAVFMESLRAKGWPVTGVDLGDLLPEKSAIREQGQMKYVAQMNALREMGYVAVGIGKTEIASDLLALLANYGYQKEQRPFTLAGNAVGVSGGKIVPRQQWFSPNPDKKDVRPVVELTEVGTVGAVPVGVAGVVGKSLALDAKNAKLDPTLDFLEVPDTLKAAAAALARHPLKPQLNVLVYQGTSEDAAKVAKDFPQFQVILCQADTDLPPLMPTTAPGTKTLVVQVGHKGQHVGVLGAFKKPDGTFEFKYQLVPMGEEYITPGKDEDARKANKVLPILEEYAKSVRAANLLTQYPRVPHPAQIQAQGLKPPAALSYVGSDACAKCHAAEHALWAKAHHGRAMEALEKIATRPTLRQYDPECVRCHSVGFEYQTGYVDEKKTAHLKHVGCESCHGPGSGHVANPKGADFLALMSPWKQADAKKLPAAEFMEKMANTPAAERGRVAIAPAQQLLITRVEGTCMKCHDQENDPHFDLYKYWPKVNHSGLAPAGGWPAVAPK
ncbi:MAG: cytochrome c family protein [Planctomycetes bacterium]|nr:cytochrome c family protein [Planctomycetota bacterium]